MKSPVHLTEPATIVPFPVLFAPFTEKNRRMLGFSTAKVRMTAIRVITLTAFSALLLLATVASAKLPARNMTVELRVLSESDAASQGVVTGGAVVRTYPVQERELEIQKVYVMNGERAHLKLGASMPVQWVKTAVSHTASGTTATGDASAAQGQGVDTATTWMDAGQGLAVKVSWPGGRQPAVVEVEVDMAAVDARAGQNLPHQSRSRVATTVVTPLGEWSTIAVTGGRPVLEQAGVYSTRSLESDGAKLMQVRVLAP